MIEIYLESMNAYRKAAALRNWGAAEIALCTAIDNCPVPEALPALSRELQQVSLKAHPCWLVRTVQKLGVGA